MIGRLKPGAVVVGARCCASCGRMAGSSRRVEEDGSSACGCIDGDDDVRVGLGECSALVAIDVAYLAWDVVLWGWGSSRCLGHREEPQR